MSKRFTDTNKWKKSFIKNLPSEYKLLWLYVLDECDHAGIWHAEIEVAGLRLGLDVTEEKALSYFADKVVVFDEGEKWFIPDFIEFQYGELNPANRAHKSAIDKLKKYNLIENEENGNKELVSPLQGAKDKDKDKVKDMDKDKGGVGENLEPEENKYKPTDEDAESIYQEYPRKVGKGNALKKIKKALIHCRDDLNKTDPYGWLFQKTVEYANSDEGQGLTWKSEQPYPATWFNQERYLDDPNEWKKKEQKSNTQTNGNYQSAEDFKRDLEELDQLNEIQ